MTRAAINFTKGNERHSRVVHIQLSLTCRSPHTCQHMHINTSVGRVSYETIHLHAQTCISIQQKFVKTLIMF